MYQSNAEGYPERNIISVRRCKYLLHVCIFLISISPLDEVCPGCIYVIKKIIKNYIKNIKKVVYKKYKKTNYIHIYM